MSDGVAETFERLAREAQLKQAADLLLSLTEEERANLKPHVRKLLTKAWRDESFYSPPVGIPQEEQLADWQGRRVAFQVVRLGALATFEISELKKLRWTESGDAGIFFPHWEEWPLQLLRVLVGLKPAWAYDFAGLLLSQSINHWFFVRAMEREGLCIAPRTHQYTFGMASELVYRLSSMRLHWDRESEREDVFVQEYDSLKDALLADPPLMDAIWGLFDYEGDSNCSLAALEAGKEEKDSWHATLLALADEGRISRKRLLDKCLEAVARDFKPYYAAWFVGLHNEMEPTPAEIDVRQERYVQFLGSSNPATVKLGLDALSQLQKHGTVDYRKVVESIDPVFLQKSRGTILRGLRLLAAAVKSQPALAQSVVRKAVQGLLNEAPQVQEAVLKFVGSCATEVSGIPGLLHPYSDSIAASNRPLFAQLAGEMHAVPVQEEVSATNEPAPATAVSPIVALDELIDRAAYVLENPEDVIQLERVLDGLVRLSNLRRADMPSYASALVLKCNKVAPHEQRSGKLLGMFAVLLRNWITGANDFPNAVLPEPSYDGFFVRRLLGLQKPVMHGHSLPLLAAPEDISGGIRPAALVERAVAWLNSPFEPVGAEVVAAILRLGEEGRAQALAGAKSLRGEVGAAIRYALGEGEVAVGSNSSLWIAAARRRFPRGDDPAVAAVHPGYGPDAAEATRYSWSILATGRRHWPFERLLIRREPAAMKPLSPDHFAPLIADATRTPALGSDGFFFFYLDDVVSWRWATTVWPAGTEAFLANGAHLLANHSQTSAKEYFRTLRYLFELIHCPAIQPGAMAELFVALACISRSGEVRSLAVDALVRLTAEGRLEKWNLGTPLGRLSHTESLFFGGRFQVVLNELSRVSVAHQKAAWQLLHSFFESGANPKAKELGKLLDTFLELTLATSRSVSEPARTFLASLSVTPKLKRILSKLT